MESGFIRINAKQLKNMKSSEWGVSRLITIFQTYFWMTWRSSPRIHGEGPVVPSHKPASGCNQVHLRFAPSAVFKGSAQQVTVAIRHTFQLNIRGQVADQPAGQRSIRDNGFDAIPDARRGVTWRGVRSRGRARARAHRAGVGTWRVTLPDVRRRLRRRVSLGIQTRVDLKDHRD